MGPYLGARLFFVEALRALDRHKLRTALTALGIMVGVAAVIWWSPSAAPAPSAPRRSCTSSATTWSGSRPAPATSTACVTAATAPPRSLPTTPRRSAARSSSSRRWRRTSTARRSSSTATATGTRTYTYLDDILCSAVAPDQVNAAVDAVQALMRQRHHIHPGEDDDFNVRRPDEIIKAQIQASRTLSLLLISLASIALLVGGIGIMNVMLASVAQRTSEIGLRLAVGATQWAVRLQFLGEAVMLSLFGGLFGLALSVGGGVFIEDLLGWRLRLPVEGALLAVVFSVGVGVLFGFYPAWRAARLDPIAALRNE